MDRTLQKTQKTTAPIRRRGRAMLAILCLLIACNSSDDERQADAGRVDSRVDAGTRDSHHDSAVPDATSPDVGTACAPPYQGDESWTYELTATPRAHYCVMEAGGTLWERIQNKYELRFVPGSYKLPESEGEFVLTLPLCLQQGNETSRITEPGTLEISFQPLGTSTWKHLTHFQKLTLGGRSWTLRSRWTVMKHADQPHPQLVLDELRTHGSGPDFSTWYRLCPTEACETHWPLFACGENELARDTAVSFDRGSATFGASTVMNLGGGGHTAAALWRAEGVLDGTPFSQTDYYKLAHQPDHHNHNGGFLVLFDQPIGDACGLEVHVPSTDGSFIYDQVEGWTIDCDGNQLQALAGLTVTQHS